ncbi:uncharacterized protein SPAPADRAFT_67303 [Spathaspora passalidarum NRRL Y-27907]|uniref:Uncharacterized protein n=1 Tax=Spathaspora passalidarum (strain NRRL Y-27907 / 11-Y1) TaxID=619300 RepID=G3AR46_SPAPN|nr:uncharacterized protein SPAPADRAFT_67303 [Spathaspora passalidarum NRRL Y-27907]EGW31221.1 hypothetical protein SPAPADRAFT_67303 [Spathaspora passalidarum NRRL Y-27907]
MLAKELFNIIGKSTKKYNIISVIPGDGKIITHEDENVLEIGIPKRTYLSMFKQAHDTWQDMSGMNIDDIYYMTLGYLITTNEHHTILKLHRKVTFQLIQERGWSVLAQELQYITSILTCRMSRINKSSSLWHWLKMLTVLSVYINKSTSTYELVIDRAIKSCELHFANYYGCNFLRWVIQINRVIDVPVEFDDVLRKLVISSCRTSLSDCGLWGVLQVYLSTGDIEWTINDLRRIVDSLRQEGLEFTSPVLQIRNTDHVACAIEQLDWLILVQCLVVTPYKSVVQAIPEKTVEEKLTNASTKVRQLAQEILTSKKN